MENIFLEQILLILDGSQTTFFFYTAPYTANGGRRVRLYFRSRSDRGTICGSEELFVILSLKKIF